MRLTDLPTAMRDFGVEVVEVAGWQTRGIAFPRSPIGGIDHWTVGASRGEIPSLAILTYGRSDLTGPLCNVARGRAVDGRKPRAFMVSSGKANHAGRGRWQTTQGVADSNYDLFGLEVEYRPWSEPIMDADLDVDARIHAAAAQVCGYASSDVAGHWEYARPLGRKVDRSTIGGGDLRALVALAINDMETNMAVLDPDTRNGLVILTYLSVLNRKPENLTVIAKGADFIAKHGFTAYVMSVADSKEAKARGQ